MDLSDLLATPVVLPSLPRTVALLSAELAAPEPSLSRLVPLFASDPALTARLLMLANAPSCQMTGRIGGIAEALMLLAPPRLRALVQAAQQGGAARSVPGVDLPAFWRYSQRTARLTRSLACLGRHNASHAYVAGLIHAMGEWVIHLQAPDRAAALNLRMGPLDPRRARLQQQTWGFAYPQVSAGLARRWQLPTHLIDALQHMQTPLDHDACEPLAGLLHLAAWRVRAQQAGLDAHALAVSFPGEVGEVLGLDMDMVLQQEPIDWTAQGADA